MNIGYEYHTKVETTAAERDKKEKGERLLQLADPQIFHQHLTDNVQDISAIAAIRVINPRAEGVHHR